MTRLVLAIIAAVALSGCQHSGQQAIDPFWGRTTVPPPATGSIGTPIITPGYQQPCRHNKTYSRPRRTCYRRR